ARQPELQKARDTSSCRPCPVTASSPVCGSDGHNYASEVCRVLPLLHALGAPHQRGG
ncbi:hypothetical protein CRUP_036047, partial [Coryphaenoides rupestris]